MTRGLDLHNPFNLEKDDQPWEGLSPTQPDPTFLSFVDDLHGLRAGIKVFYAYQRRGLDTVYTAIHEFAPPEENDTGAYIDDVCSWCSVSAVQTLDFHNTAFMLVWARAVIRQEQGVCPFSDEQITQAIQAANE